MLVVLFSRNIWKTTLVMTNYAKNYACTVFQSLKTMNHIFTQYEKFFCAPWQVQIWVWVNELYGSFRTHFSTQYDRKCFLLDTVDTGYFWDLFTPLWVKGNACSLSRPRPKRLEVTPKSAIYTRKRDEEHPSHFYMGVLPENRSTDLQREKTGVCAIQDYSYHKDFNVNISSEKLMLY